MHGGITIARQLAVQIAERPLTGELTRAPADGCKVSENSSKRCIPCYIFWPRQYIKDTSKYEFCTVRNHMVIKLICLHPLISCSFWLRSNTNWRVCSENLVTSFLVVSRVAPLCTDNKRKKTFYIRLTVGCSNGSKCLYIKLLVHSICIVLMFSYLLEQMMLFCAVMFESEHTHILWTYRDVRKVSIYKPLAM